VSDALFGEPKKERLTYQLGVFKETDDWPSANDGDEDQGYQITGRVTGLPLYKDEGRKLIHVGLAYSLRNPDGARPNYGVRPESRLALFRTVNPDNLPVSFRLRDARADDIDLLGAELAGVYGPFSLQGEYVHSAVDTTFGGDVDFAGYYAQASYFLTGEHRPYRNDSGVFDRVVPNRNFGFKPTDGYGAWELTARYSFADVQDGPIHGGEHASYTLGVNWYLNPNARITVNYVHNDVEHDLYDGDFDFLQARFQLEF
jgi:phosphate-selective porin OprO/OprP